MPLRCILLIVALGGLMVACETRQPSQDRDVAAQPAGPGDSLARLLRRQLTDPDPAAIQQAIMCEHFRLRELYGSYKAHSIAEEVRDTIYSLRDRPALVRVDRALANRVFRTDCGRPLGSPRPTPRGDTTR